MKKVYFPHLDGLRWIAFFAIFLHHAFQPKDLGVAASRTFEWIEAVTRPTGFGVPFFFCLSGFLISYLLWTERAERGRIHIGRFYLRRILRIWPLYYAVVCFGFFGYPLLKQWLTGEGHTEPGTLWRYLAFLGNFDYLAEGPPQGVGLSVTWSISVEEQFYLLWPLVLAVVPRRWFPVVGLAAFAAANVAVQHYQFAYHHTLGSLSDLSMGGLLAWFCMDAGKCFGRLQAMPRWLIGAIYGLGLVHAWSLALDGPGNEILLSLFMAFVIFEQCYCAHSFFKMGRFRTWSYLGTLTYGFYLLHPHANLLAYNLLRGLGLVDMAPSWMELVVQPILSLLLTLGIGHASYYLLERPFLRLKKRLARLDTTSARRDL